MDWAESEYLRERLNPRFGDQFYLHLSDLLIAIKHLRPASISKVLDYGCGGSPYRQLFEECVYHRADLRGGTNLDFEFGPDAHLPPELSNYDCVLSTQVLEHVENPKGYLDECYRVLRPGGYLILTTHGLFKDHACPYDYWRWTALGLKRAVESANLRVEAVKKLTTGLRGATFLAERELYTDEGERLKIDFRAAGLYGMTLSFFLRLLRRLGSARRHKASDALFTNCRVVDIGDAGHNSYVAIAVLATREG
ncbi:MAG: class I SAM-dependent methyltransferase [Hyphomicrobiales bacterium]|nr:class I SAM-dependent methyltransferase [Acidobacteriaceae bacterium]MBV9974861.1 class I SAM-dependent methyltransferase [Hyphomicrobiales bacterium]